MEKVMLAMEVLKFIPVYGKSFLFSKKQEIIENGYATNPYLYEWYLETCKN